MGWNIAGVDAVLRKGIGKLVGEKGDSEADPAIAAVGKRVRWICRQELERLQRRWPGMGRSERAELELMLDRITEQIVRPVIVELNAIEAAEARDKTEVRHSLVTQLFGAS